MWVRLLSLFPLLLPLALAGDWQRLHVGHVDLRIVHSEAHGLALQPFILNPDRVADAADLTLVVGPEARQPRPDSALWAPLGVPPGTQVWILPQAFDPNLLWVGTRADIGPTVLRPLPPAPVFGSGQLGLRLTAVAGSGPAAGGFFALFSLDLFGTPDFAITSADGLDPQDDLVAPINASSHTHYNWAFTSPGDYLVSFEVFGYRRDNGSLLRAEQTFHFQVLPEEPVLEEPLRVGVSEAGIHLSWTPAPASPPVTIWQSHDLERWWIAAVTDLSQALFDWPTQPTFWRLDAPATPGPQEGL